MQIKKIIAIFFSFSAFFRFASGQFNDINNGDIINHSHITPNLLGGGVGIIDINNDGWEDIYLTGGVEGDKLLFNKGDLQFEDISISSFIFQNSRSYHTNCVTIGDINNDGYEDIFLGTKNGQPSILLLNSGENTFQNISSTSGISPYTDWTMGSLFIDVNQDGFLDLYLVNYISEFKSILNDQNEVIGFDHTCAKNNLFINNGNLTFTEKSKDYGIDSNGCGLAVSTCDINNDGYLDLIVANDFGEWVIPNQLFVYQEESASFTEQANIFNLQDSIYGMGVAVSDINADQKDDFFITNIGASTFKLSSQNNQYQPIDSTNGFYRSDQIGWGVLFADIDNDSDDDLYVSNGFISTADFIGEETSDSSRLYVNSNTEFNEVTSEFNILNNGQSRGSAFCDLNNDGLLDIISVNVDRTHFDNKSNVNIYINQADRINNWVSFILKGTDNLSVLGSTITVYSNGYSYSRQLRSGGSHASSSSFRVHFGLINASHIDSVKVIWPNSLESTYYDIQINSHIGLTQQASNHNILNCESENWGCPIKEPLFTENSQSFQVYPNPSNGIITIVTEVSEEIYRIYDSTGQLILEGYAKPKQSLKLTKRGIYYLRIDHQVKKIVILN